MAEPTGVDTHRERNEAAALLPQAEEIVLSFVQQQTDLEQDLFEANLTQEEFDAKALRLKDSTNTHLRRIVNEMAKLKRYEDILGILVTLLDYEKTADGALPSIEDSLAIWKHLANPDNAVVIATAVTRPDTTRLTGMEIGTREELEAAIPNIDTTDPWRDRMAVVGDLVGFTEFPPTDGNIMSVEYYGHTVGRNYEFFAGLVKAAEKFEQE